MCCNNDLILPVVIYCAMHMQVLRHPVVEGVETFVTHDPFTTHDRHRTLSSVPNWTNTIQSAIQCPLCKFFFFSHYLTSKSSEIKDILVKSVVTISSYNEQYSET